MQSHYLFAEKFGRPAKGNDKGKVEGLVGYARRNFLVPIPRVASWEELNEQLLQRCRERRMRRLRGHQETIGERCERDRASFLSLPASEYEACEKRVARVSGRISRAASRGDRHEKALHRNLTPFTAGLLRSDACHYTTGQRPTADS